MHEEAEEARQAGKLMPVLIEHVRPPPGFREVQTADLASWDQSPSDPAFRQLNLDIGAVLKASPVPEAVETPASKTTGPEAKPKNNRRKIVMALLATIIVFVAGTVLISLTWNWQTVVERPVSPLVPSEPAEPDGPASEPPPDLTKAPPRDLPEHKGEQAVSEEPSLEKPELPSESGVRCANILQRLQLGELLSDQDRSYLQRECAR